MQLVEMQNLVNYQRRESTESFISNDEITAYLNEANRKITREYEFESNKVSTTFTYTDGSIRYALSAIAADLDEPINFFYSSSQYFTPASPQQFMQLSSYNNDMYAIDGSYLLLKTSFGTGIISFNYYTTNTAKTSGGSLIEKLSSSTDEPLMPELNQDTLVDFALFKCFKKEGMADDAASSFDEYKTGLKSMKTKTPSRKVHYQKVMRSPRKLTSGYSQATKNDVLNNY